MTIESVKKDLENLIARMQAQDPDIDAEVRIWERTQNTRYSTIIPSDTPVVQDLIKAHKAIFQNEAKIQNREPRGSMG